MDKCIKVTEEMVRDELKGLPFADEEDDLQLCINAIKEHMCHCCGCYTACEVEGVTWLMEEYVYEDEE